MGETADDEQLCFRWLQMVEECFRTPNPCLWGQEAPCPVEELGINTVMETQGWARGADGRGICFDADVQTLQRNLSVSRELPLTWLLSQHQFPWWRAEH